MDRFEHAEPRLTSGENFIIREKGVRLFDGDEKVSFRTSDIVEYIVYCCAMPCVVVDIGPVLEQVLSTHRWVSTRLRRLIPEDDLYSHHCEIQNVVGWSCIYKVEGGYYGHQRFGGTLASILYTLWCHNTENQGVMNVWFQYVIFLLLVNSFGAPCYITFLKCFFLVWF